MENNVNEAVVDTYMELILRKLDDIIENGYNPSKGLLIRFYMNSILSRADSLSEKKLAEINATAVKMKNILLDLQKN